MVSDTHENDSLLVPPTEQLPLHQILANEELAARPTRAPDYQSEAMALGSLSETLTQPSEDILQKLADFALSLCGAGSAGVSIAEDENGTEIFRWRGVAGRLSPFLQGTMPRDFSPCGHVVKTGSHHLMVKMIGHYQYVHQLGLPLYEVLLVPFYLHGKPVGTIWAVAHSESKKFDAEDLRLLNSLARFASAGYQSKILVEQERQSKLLVENERENFRKLFKQTPEMVCILAGPNHVFEFVNDAHVKVLGFDATGKAVRDAQPESVEIHGVLDRVFQTGITAELNEIPVTVTNRLRYFNLTYSARKNSQGVTEGIMILGTEVTDEVLSRSAGELHRKSLELALNDSPMQEVFDTLARMAELQVGQSLRAAILVTDKEGQHLLHGGAPSLPTAYNNAVHGIKIGNNIGSCGTAAFRKERVIVEHIASSPLWADYKEVAATHGLEACWSIPILTAKSQLLGTFAFYSNVPRRPSEKDLQVAEISAHTAGLIIERRNEMQERREGQKKLEAYASQLEAAKIQAESANNAKSSFLANMSHEIRSPLGAIMGFTELLKSPQLEFAEKLQYLGIIERNSEQLMRVIDDILDLSKVEAGQMTLEQIEFSLLELLADFSSIAQFKAQEGGISFELQLEGALPAKIISDPIRIRQILNNVVGNALKFTSSGRVQLKVRYQSDQLSFEVQDTGRGISTEQAARLFKPFTQADLSTTRKFGGTGLGLVLTRSLCEVLGGTFDLMQSQLEKGSTFLATVRAPAATNASIVPATEIQLKSSLAKVPREEKKKFAGLKIHLVEDSPDNQMLFKAMIEHLGGEVIISTNGRMGVERALSEPADVLLMDIQMPEMDGHSAVRLLRSQGFKTPIIALTAHAMKEEVKRAMASGFNSFVTKPVAQDKLIEAVIACTALGK